MTRTQRNLAGLLLIQVVLVLLFRSPLSSTTSSSEPVALLPQLASLEASRIQFQGKDGETLNIAQKDGSWTLVESDHYPANNGKIEDLLQELEDVTVRRPVVSSNRYHETFKVTEQNNEGRLQIWGDDPDSPSVDLILGSSSNYQLSHVRAADDDRVFEVRGLAPYDVRASAEDWVEKSLMDVPEAQVVGFTLSNPNGDIEVVRESGSWRFVAPPEMVGAALDPTRVDALLRIARSLRIESPAGVLNEEAQGLANPEAVMTLRMAPSGDDPGSLEDVVVRIGDRLPGKDTQRFVTRSGLGFAASIWESSLQELIGKTPSDLLVSVDTIGDADTVNLP